MPRSRFDLAPLQPPHRRLPVRLLPVRMAPVRMAPVRMAVAAITAATLLLAAPHAQALVIDAGFGSAITGAANAAAIETAVTTAVGDIARLYRNAGTVSILFTTAPGGFLGQSNTGLYSASYAGYTGLLAADSAANPGNSALASAVANLPLGNDANGARPIVMTSALLRVGLGDTLATPCFSATGSYINGCGGVYDGVVTLSSSQPIDYTRPISNGYYDAIRVIEHEVDEVLGGGGGGSTLNAIAASGLNNAANALTYYDGVLDLYRYSAKGTPSFTTASSATAYLSVDGGKTSIAGFNQTASGDFGDFLSTNCPNDVQDAFTCTVKTADVTPLSPEFRMLEAIGYNPVPEPASLALFGGAVAALSWTRRRRGARDRRLEA
jgi:hypothetical protein